MSAKQYFDTEDALSLAMPLTQGFMGPQSQSQTQPHTQTKGSESGAKMVAVRDKVQRLRNSAAPSTFLS